MSYGVNAPFGLQPRRFLTGAPWNGATNTYFIASGYGTALFNGDPVIKLADGTIGIGVVNANPLLGVFQGCKYIDTNNNEVQSPYWPAAQTILANTTVEAYVVDDPNVIFDIQTNDATGTFMVLAKQGFNATFSLATAGSTVSGLSGATLDTVTTPPAATQALALKILRPTPVPGNTFPQAYDNFEVIINNHIYKSLGTVGIGT